MTVNLPFIELQCLGIGGIFLDLYEIESIERVPRIIELESQKAFIIHLFGKREYQAVLYGTEHVAQLETERITKEWIAVKSKHNNTYAK